MRGPFFRAKITGVDTSAGYPKYSWEERAADITDGSDYAPQSFRSGTHDVNPLVEINDNTIPTGTLVWVRERGYVVGEGMWFETQYETGSSGTVSGEIVINPSGSALAIGAGPSYTATNTVTVPSAGKWELRWGVYCTGYMTSGAPSDVVARVWDVTAGANINALPAGGLPYAFHIMSVPTNGYAYRAQVQITCRVNTTGSNGFRLELVRGSGTWLSCELSAGSGYVSWASYMKL